MPGMRIPEVCISLGVSPSTLQSWRKKGTGPEWKLDYRGRVWYSDAAVIAWRSRGSDPYAGADPYAKLAPPTLSPDPAPRKAWDPPSFITEQAALPPTRKAQTPRPQPGEIRPQGVPSSAEWDSHHIAWVWEEDGELLMAGSDGARI